MSPQIIKDPTLPPGWEALYDDGQRVTYYWNKASNVTQYERPAGGPAPAVRHDWQNKTAILGLLSGLGKDRYVKRSEDISAALLFHI